MRLLGLFVLWLMFGLTGCSKENSPSVDPALSTAQSVSTSLEAPVTSSHVKDTHPFYLPEPLQEAVTKFDPEFVTWKTQDYTTQIVKIYPFSGKSWPFAIIGDFNGDGKDDAMLMGHNRIQDRELLVLSSETGYFVLEQGKVSTLSKPDALYSEMYDETGDLVRDYGLEIFLKKIEKGQQIKPMGEPGFKAERDAFERIYTGKSSFVGYWQNGALKEYWTSD